MKRKVFIIITVLCSVLMTFAEQIRVDDIALVPGCSTSVEITMDNEHTNIVAFQMDLTLPEGIGIDKTGCTLSSRIVDEEQRLTVGLQQSGAYRLTSTSFSLTPISGTSGTLLTLKLTSEESFVNGQVCISNIIFSTSSSEEVLVDNNVTFTINTLYALTYKVDGTEYKSDTVAYGTSLTPESEPVKEGYSFSGWSELPETMPSHDVVITGTFTVNKYLLTYKIDGEVYKTDSIAYGTALTLEAEPVKEGYTFSGWSEFPETMPSHDVVVTGTFTINKYLLTYKVDGEVYKTDSIAYGAALAQESEPVKEGYTFSGWSDLPETMPAEDVMIFGTFTVNNYTGDTILEVICVEYGAEIPLPESLNSERYSLIEWLDVPETMPAHDIVIYASYVDGIDSMADGRSYAIYDEKGIRISRLKRGINIIRMYNGKTLKVMIK